MPELFGEFAGLATAFCWAFTSIFFTIGGSRVGSVVVNRTRLVLAVIFLSTTHLILIGTIYPVDADIDRWLWLGLSGVIGLVLGDALLFQAFVMIGARLSMLLMSLVPIMSTLLAWVFLGESLTGLEIFGIALTISGVSWVVLDKHKENSTAKNPRFLPGILFGIGGAFGQAAGLLTSKLGLYGDFSPLSGNLIRMLIAASVMWLVTIAAGKAKKTIYSLKDLKALKAIISGSVVGPFLGVWLSLVAIKYARIGIASTLMALTPILMIPIVRWIFKERISIQAVIGTVIALVGVSILFIK